MVNPQHDPLSNDPESEAIELAAAEWLVRQDQAFSVQDQRDFERWCTADPRHGPAYALLKRTWHQLEAVPADRVPLPRRTTRPWLWVVTSLTAAAAAVAIVLMRPSPPATAPVQQHAVTTVGGYESLTLADGSVVRLNTASEISVDFTSRERRVALLRGEASFEVEKDAERPFIVRVGEVDVRAVGTVFNIRRGDDAIEVLVTEGKVRLDDAVSGQQLTTMVSAVQSVATPAAPSAATRLLIAGQRATIRRTVQPAPVQAKIAEVLPEETARTLAWHKRRLEFSEESLANIAAEFNRYNHHRLTIDDPELAAQRFGGKFAPDDTAALVRLLELNFGVQAERRENEIVLRRGPAAR